MIPILDSIVPLISYIMRSAPAPNAVHVQSRPSPPPTPVSPPFPLPPISPCNTTCACRLCAPPTPQFKEGTTHGRSQGRVQVRENSSHPLPRSATALQAALAGTDIPGESLGEFIVSLYFQVGNCANGGSTASGTIWARCVS